MPHIPGHVDGLLNQNPPPPPGGRRPPSLLGDVEQWAESPVGQMDPLAMTQETNRQRAMAGYPGHAWIGPQQSRGSRILDHLRYSVPRMVGDFGRGLARETPRGLLDLARTLGAESVGGPGGWITNLIDQPWSPQAPETGAGKAGGFGGMMASEVAAGLISDAASATRGVRELADPEGSTAVGLLELASSVPFLGMAAVPLVASTRAAIKASRSGLDAVSNSRLEKFFLDTQQGKATGSQWLATLKKAPGGIPEGEMEWTGITKLLGENPDRKFTRAELQQHMADNGIKLKETWRAHKKWSDYEGWNEDDFVTEIQKLEREAHRHQQLGDEAEAKALWDEVSEVTRAQEEFAGFGFPGTPKFGGSDTRIEGPSENYRELTIQLERPNQARMDRLLKEQEELMFAQYGGRTPYRTPDGDWVDLPPEVEVRYDALTEQINSLNRPPEFTGGHWRENNVLVHLRMSDRTVINPKTGKPEKVLFIEEIQSDWHQKGRDQGYQQSRTPDPEEVRLAQEEFDAAEAELNEIVNETVLEGKKTPYFDVNRSVLFPNSVSSNWDGGLVDMATTADGYVFHRQPDGSWATMGGDSFPSGVDLLSEMGSPNINVPVSWGRRNAPGEEVFRTNELGLVDKATDRQVELSSLMADATTRRNNASATLRDTRATTTGGIPQGPYQNVDEWSELAMKRAIQEGVEGGYDRVAWASGRQASELYNLRKQVSKIDYDPDTGHLEAYDLDGDRFITKRGVTPEQLPEYIGKEPADRLLSAKPRKSIEYYIEESSHPATKRPRFNVFESKPGEDDWMASSHLTRADAEKAVTQKNQVRSIEGEDLEVGGEGMIGFYDKIIPRMTNKYGNQVGGIEIEGMSLSNRPPDGAENLTAAQLKQGVKELGIEETPFIKEWIKYTELMGNTTKAVDGWTSLERMKIRRYEDRILGHLKTSPESGVMTNQSFAITPEMRAKVGQEGQRLYSATGPGLLGTSAVARQLGDDEQNQQRGLLQPPIGPPRIRPDRTPLTDDEEQEFQSWYRGVSSQLGIDPDPDHEKQKYDYRGAWKSGYNPLDDKAGHWPSAFKDDDHPNRIIRQDGQYYDTKNEGLLGPPIGPPLLPRR